MDGTAKPTQLADGDDLEAFLERHEVALVELYTTGCPKCQAMEPVLGNVVRATGVPVGTVDLGDDVGLADRFEVSSVPTLILFVDGEEVTRRATGFVGADELVSVLEDHVPNAVD